MKKVFLLAILVVCILFPAPVLARAYETKPSTCTLFTKFSPVYHDDPTIVRDRYATINTKAPSCDLVNINLFPDVGFVGKIVKRAAFTCGPTLSIASGLWKHGYFMVFVLTATPPIPFCIQPDIRMDPLQVWSDGREKYVAVSAIENMFYINNVVKIEELK